MSLAALRVSFLSLRNSTHKVIKKNLATRVAANRFPVIICNERVCDFPLENRDTIHSLKYLYDKEPTIMPFDNFYSFMKEIEFYKTEKGLSLQTATFLTRESSKRLSSIVKLSEADNNYNCIGHALNTKKHLNTATNTLDEVHSIFNLNNFLKVTEPEINYNARPIGLYKKKIIHKMLVVHSSVLHESRHDHHKIGKCGELVSVHREEMDNQHYGKLYAFFNKVM
jgi:hypothetical protein